MQKIIKKVLDNKTKINIALFYIAYTLMVFFWMTTNVKYIDVINKYTIKIAYLVVVLSCFFGFTKKDIKDWKTIFLFIALICSGVSWIISDSNILAILVLFIIAAKNIKFENIIKYDFKLRVVLTSIVVLLYVLDLTENHYIYRENGDIRSSMGFSHPNTFGIYILLLCAEYIYLNYKKMTWKSYVVILIVDILLIYFANSRASVIAILLLLVGTALCKITKNKIIENKLVKNLLPYLFIIFTLISIILCTLYNPVNFVIRQINDLLSGRIYLAKKYLEDYDVNLFGNELEIVSTYEAENTGEEARVLDNGFINIILQYGIVNYIFLVIMLYIAIQKALSEKDYILCIIMSIYIVVGILENGAFTLYKNTFLIYISNAIYFNNKNEKCLMLGEYE